MARYRLVPPAVTPVRAADIAGGLGDHLRGVGRDRFRERVRGFLGGTSAATYTSFRRALAACLRALDAADDGSRVLLPAFCSGDFRAAVEGVGLDPVRYDVDPATLAADPDAVAARTDGETLAVVAVNVLGYGSSMDELSAFCTDRDVRLVEALGYALGARYDGAPLGTFGDCAVANFQQGKPVPVGGGMVVSRDPALAFDDAGRDAVAPNVGALAGYAAFGRPRAYYCYDRLRRHLPDGGRATTHPEPKDGIDYAPPFATMSNFQCAVADRVWDRRETYRRARAATARAYATALEDVPDVDRVRPVEGLSRHQHVRYPLLVAADRRAAVRAALADAGLATSVLYDWPPLDADRFPGAARLQREIVTLPTHPYVAERDRRAAIEAVRAALDGRATVRRRG